MKREWVFILLMPALLLSACSALPVQASPIFAFSSGNPPAEQPFQTGVQIAKPTYTPSPFPAPTFTAEPAFTSTPVETTIPAAFADVDFVVIENLPPPQSRTDPAASYSGSKYILVDISEQHMYVYDGDVLVYEFVASTGMDNSTRVGTFSVLDKIPNAYGATWNIWMPNWLGIYWSGSLENGIHALPILPNGATLWAGFLGTPISYGCVVLGTDEAQLLYDWAEVGMPVEIRW
jgi:lipoprotein-anchoring transpeptidase ErfK/SrfK